MSTRSASAQGFDALVPDNATLGETASQAIAAAWLTDEERSAMRVFHGVWGQHDLRDIQLRAQASLLSYDLGNPALSDERVPVEFRAEALLLQGELRQAIETLEGVDSLPARRIRADALHALGRFNEAVAVAREVSSYMARQRVEDAAQFTEGVRTLLIGTRAEGEPARDFQLIMGLLARSHQELDRLYWPAKLAEALLLAEKHNRREAVTALHEVLRLNPRCSDAWYELGQIALGSFDFDSAQLAAQMLQQINPEHPLANLLIAESRLIQDDPDGAFEALEPLLERWPRMRRGWELLAAANAITWDAEATQQVLDQYDELSPGSARAYYTVGRQLSFNRQYDWAAEILQEAIRREPRWPAPSIELGLMELQSGRDHIALSVLRDVIALDPFNKRAANSLFLLEDLTTYDRLENDHFIVRYKPGIDQIMVDMMPEQLDAIHQVLHERFGWELDRKTIIELMPDHQRFAVRIVGMPSVHTIAASTGPVLAMQVPREARAGEPFGVFDWPRVLRHEYTHTVTLAQTNNRIPHWLTEAAAVEMELAPRSYDRCRLLADAYLNGTLFDLEELKWAFVRPRRPNDRSKAYAQSHWMVQYMDAQFGTSGLVRLLAAYFDGEREAQAMPRALGVSRAQFYEGFLQWAGEQVKSWGLAPQPSLQDLLDQVRWNTPELALQMAASSQARLDVIVRAMGEQIGRPAGPLDQSLTPDLWPPLVRPNVQVTGTMIENWLLEHPDHPDLWELRIRRRLEQQNDVADDIALQWLAQYATLRPVDPYPHMKLAQHWLGTDTPQRAIEHLEFLDAREEYSPVYALELARLYRDAGDLDLALNKATRALHINPYHAPTRELAAAVALQLGNLPAAHQHIRALTLLEPDRPLHQRRLQRIEELMSSSSATG